MVRRTNLAVVILALCGLLALSGPAWATDGNDPISHWMLDEGTGVTAYDSVGSNHGTLVNGPLWTTGQIGGALDFDGVDDYVDLGNDSSLKPPLPVTLCAWVNLSSLGADQRIIALDKQIPNYWGVAFRVRSTNHLEVGYHDGGSPGPASRRNKYGTTALSVDRWYHVAAVLRGPTDMELYIDGVDDAGTYIGTAGSLAYSADGDSFLGSNTGLQNYFNGIIDDVRVYDRALSAGEIQALYMPGGPVSHWTFDEGAGTTAYDSAGSNHGTLVNGPVWTGGQIDGALCFDGVDDYVDLGNDSSLKPPLPVTLSAWINLSRNDAVVICLDESSSIYYGVTLLVDISSHATITFGDGNGWGSSAYRRSKTGTTALDTDTWYHVAGVVRGATDMDVYINGVDDGGTYSGTGGSLAYSSANASIGTSHYEDICFDGKIDDVRLYDRALSAEEVQALYLRGGPVSHWTFDEGAGTTAYDSAGSNHGTLVNGPVWTSGQIDGALEFDGFNDYVDVGDTDSLDFQADDSFSVSAWIKCNKDESTVVAKRDHDGWYWQEGYEFRIYEDKLYFVIEDITDAYTQIFGSTIVTDDWWHHVAAVRNTDEDKVYIYIDGTADGTAVTDTTSATLSTVESFRIGRTRPGQYFGGIIDDVRVYKRALSAQEIQGLWQEAGWPIAHWEFDEGEGDIAYDSAGDNDGTIYGAEWTDGIIDGALDFDGVDDYVDLGNDSSLKPPLPVTLSAWINFSQDNKTIISLDDCSSKYYGVLMSIKLYRLRVDFGDGTGWGSGSYRRSKEGTTALSPDTWYHVAGVVRGATDMDLYIDGVDDGGTYSGTGGSLAYSSANASIGTCHYENICFDGKIDDVRLYDRALSAEEVEELYEGGMCGVLASKSIKRALEHKIASLEELQAALAEEAAALEALNDLLASGELGDLSRRDVLRAKWKIRSAMWRERLCRAGLRRTIGKLEDALALLGCEVEPQSWPEPHTEVDDAIIRADINQDGVVNFEDIAILTEYWLKSYQVE